MALLRTTAESEGAAASFCSWDFRRRVVICLEREEKKKKKKRKGWTKRQNGNTSRKCVYGGCRFRTCREERKKEKEREAQVETESVETSPSKRPAGLTAMS